MRFPRNKKVVEATLSFSSVYSQDGRFFSLQLNDAESHLRIANINISHEAFGRMLSSSIGEKNCTVELFSDTRFGATVEHKWVNVDVEFLSYDTEMNKKELVEAVKLHEIEGWVGDTNLNRRRFDNATKTYNTIFRRWVRRLEVKEEKD